MDRYSERINLLGSTQRERTVNRLRNNLINKLPQSLSYKNVKLNGKDIQLIINAGTKPYYKEFEALPDQKVLVGDYIEWANCIWLVYEADCDDEIYIDGKMYQCNYVQRWLNNSGKLIERPSFVINASAYNNGEMGNNILTLASNQFMVYMPIDEETLNIHNGKRIFMDYNMSEPSVYNLTRPDNVSMKFGEKGVTYYIFTQTEKSKKDKQIILESGEKIWIADYFSPTSSKQNITNETTILSIISGSNQLRVSHPKTYTASFTDRTGSSITGINYSWNVDCDFIDKVNIITYDNSITLQVDDTDYIGESIILQIVIDGTVNSYLKVLISDVY